jgi:hypothetical protein
MVLNQKNKNKKMAKLSDVHFALNGGDKGQHSPEQQGIVDIASAQTKYVDTGYVIFKLKNPRKGGVYIDGTDDMWNPDTKMVERARLLTGVASIWIKDQEKIPESYVKQNKRSLEFNGKIIRLAKTDHTGLLFARLCNSNMANENRTRVPRYEFFEYDPIKQAEAALKKESLGLDMAMMVKEMDEKDVRKFASYLRILFNDELGLARPIEAIRKDLMIYANRTPEEFQKLIDDKSVSIQYQVKSAILSSKIELGKTPGGAHWGSGGFIAKIPSSAKPLEYLTELAMTNSEEGKEFLEKLNKISS